MATKKKRLLNGYLLADGEIFKLGTIKVGISPDTTFGISYFHPKLIPFAGKTYVVKPEARGVGVYRKTNPDKRLTYIPSKEFELLHVMNDLVVMKGGYALPKNSKVLHRNLLRAEKGQKVTKLTGQLFTQITQRVQAGTQVVKLYTNKRTIVYNAKGKELRFRDLDFLAPHRHGVYEGIKIHIVEGFVL